MRRGVCSKLAAGMFADFATVDLQHPSLFCGWDLESQQQTAGELAAAVVFGASAEGVVRRTAVGAQWTDSGANFHGL